MASRIAIVSASVGAGHDGAAREVARRLRGIGHDVDISDFMDLVGARTGRALRAGYEAQLRIAPRTWDWLLRVLSGRRTGGATGRLFAARAADRIAALLADPKLGAVVSVYPLASQALGELRQRGVIPVPVVTYLTDLSVHPLWVHPGVDRHVALHPVAAQQAYANGARGVAIAAPAVDPRFTAHVDPVARAAVRARYGLPADRPLALLVAGSWGVGNVTRSAAEIAGTGLVAVATVCGRNEALRRRLARQGVGTPLGWVDDMAALVAASDVVVQNAGGLSSLEALAAGVPVLSYRCLPGHGTTNAEALEAAGLASWARHPGELAALLSGMLAGPRRTAQHAAARNQAGQPPVEHVLADIVDAPLTPVPVGAAAARTVVAR